MFNYRIQITRMQDGQPQEWDFIDRVIVLWGTAWVLKSVKEVAMAYAKNK